jgi:phosphopantothenoylcysteine synthetase/decarboxylase
MKVIVTCGPSSEPIDEVRRITNFSKDVPGRDDLRAVDQGQDCFATDLSEVLARLFG